MISRRHFLQLAGSTLATVGLSQFDIINQANRYAKVLANSTPRKLALLVGINKYQDNPRLVRLNGCVTDVELQRELLIHRFGFNESNILALTDEKATRQGILTAFEEHLIKQAKPGDVVVFHFSGHGSQFYELDQLKNCTKNDAFNSTFVPVDDDVPNGMVQDIMGRTLFLLMSALETNNVTAVLDSCHSGGGTRGNYITRSVSPDGLKATPQEIEYQQRWMKQLKISQDELVRRRCQGVAKGVVLAASQEAEEAYDGVFDGFHAGVFTYLLTQYLWQQTDTVANIIPRITTDIQWLNKQNPLADGETNKPIYFIDKKVPPTDAVVIKGKGDRATLWLGGIDGESLTTFGEGATFAIVNNRGQSSGKVKIISPRNGLTVEAQLLEKGGITSLQPGMLLQESSRVVPADLKLSIGLDPSLKGEMNAAQQALSEIIRIQAIPVPYPEKTQLQYIFGKITQSDERKLRQQQVTNLPNVGSIGLFTTSRELVTESFGKPGETIANAVSRLEPKLKSLVAIHIIKTTLNADSSELSVEVAMKLVDQPNKPFINYSTARGKNNSHNSQKNSQSELPLQKKFQFELKNNESSKALNFLIFAFESSQGLNPFFPLTPFTEESMRLEPNQKQLIPVTVETTETGTAEIVVVFSSKSLKNIARTLASLAEEQRSRSGETVELKEPVSVIDKLLDDLSGERGGITEAAQVETSEVATLSIPLKVV